MRIAIIAHGLANGGAERVAALVANHYAQKGHDVLFVAAYSRDREYPLAETVRYVYVGGNSNSKIVRLLGRSFRIHREVSRFKADAAVSFVINETLYSTVFGSVPYIYTLRNDPGSVCSSPVMKVTSKLAFRKAEKVVFQTPGARDFFDSEIREKGIVIPNPLTRDLPYWNPAECDKTVITACRLNVQKNLPMLIRGFAAFHEQYPDYILKIYGKGELQSQLESYAQECGVGSSVYFPGYARDIHSIMAGTGIFAMTSDYEGLSNSMLEALAIGIPTVCTDCPPGGAAMYIEDGVSGMLVPVGDADALTEKLCAMAGDPALCRTLSENSRKIRDKLDVDKVLAQWEAVLW